MSVRIRRLLDIRRGEAPLVAFSFAYVAVVASAFLLAKPIRSGLFLREYGAYALVYAYAAVPVALTLIVPLGTRVAARVGQRRMNAGTLWFFCANVLLFWVLFRFADLWSLPAVFYVWVNCFAVIAPVQAWSFVSSMFDTRQAKRLFGVVGAGASLGALTGGLMGRLLVGPLGGTVNLLLVLAALLATAALLVTATGRLGPPRQTRAEARAGQGSGSFRDALVAIGRSPYLRLITAMVFLVAIATQWISFQFSLVADTRFGGDADRLTRFFSSFNIYTGAAAFAIQLFATGPVLRRLGLTVAILMLPFALAGGSALILIVPGFWAVLLTAGLDQGLRFSVDKASYELLYLPLTVRRRARLKAAIDMVVNRTADAAGAVLLGVATHGFLGLGGFGFGLRGTAAITLVIVSLWAAVAWRLRHAYVEAIAESIRSHRLEVERAAAASVERSAASVIDAQLASRDTREVEYALDVLEARHVTRGRDTLAALLRHASPAIRRRALRLLNESGEGGAVADVEPMVRDEDLETRTEALLYLSRHARVDPLEAVRDLRDFPEFSIRASLAGFLAAPGPAQNVEAARLMVRAMTAEQGPDAGPVRREAARLVELRPEVLRERIPDLLAPGETDEEVLRHAIRAVGRLRDPDLAPLVIPRLDEGAVTVEAIQALADCGDAVLPVVREALTDETLSLEVRRELPIVLARIGSAAAVRLLGDMLLQGDSALRYRIIASLNKLRQQHDEGEGVDREMIDLVLAAEITGHYRSYQVLAALGPDADPSDPVTRSLQHAMEHELERIFRLIALAMPGVDLHSAYVALRASDRVVRANALEFLERALKPELKPLLLPLIDPEVSLEARVRMANAMVGARIDSVERAIETLLASDDAWLRDTALAARGRLWRPGPAQGEEAAAPAAVSSGL
jgi:ATP:ADP antiporter, AAA family